MDLDWDEVIKWELNNPGSYDYEHSGFCLDGFRTVTLRSNGVVVATFIVGPAGERKLGEF